MEDTVKPTFVDDSHVDSGKIKYLVMGVVIWLVVYSVKLLKRSPHLNFIAMNWTYFIANIFKNFKPNWRWTLNVKCAKKARRHHTSRSPPGLSKQQKPAKLFPELFCRDYRSEKHPFSHHKSWETFLFKAAAITTALILQSFDLFYHCQSRVRCILDLFCQFG